MLGLLERCGSDTPHIVQALRWLNLGQQLTDYGFITLFLTESRIDAIEGVGAEDQEEESP